jgi:hypothetical protein
MALLRSVSRKYEKRRNPFTESKLGITCVEVKDILHWLALLSDFVSFFVAASNGASVENSQMCSFAGHCRFVQVSAR